MRHGTDHHSFVIFNKRVREHLDKLRTFAPGVVMNQISWQVGSLAEVMNGSKWLNEGGMKIQRVGRDMPGSNWHTYFYDSEGHTNELYYGMEQIGWDGRSKPLSMHDRGFREMPQLPQVPEDEEVRTSAQRGDDLVSGSEFRDALPGAEYDVEGVMLPRPFKVDQGRTGQPVHARRRRGRRVSTPNGSACAFPKRRFGTAGAASSCAPIPNITRSRSIRSSCAKRSACARIRRRSRWRSKSVRTGSCAMRKTFLAKRGARFVDMPAELHPGIDYALHVLDPDGQAVQVYFSMEQIGWDGKARPAAMRPKVVAGAWPAALHGGTRHVRRGDAAGSTGLSRSISALSGWPPARPSFSAACSRSRR